MLYNRLRLEMIRDGKIDILYLLHHQMMVDLKY